MLQGWGGDGASRHAHLITVSFKTQPITQEVSCFKCGGILLPDMPTTVLFKTESIRQEVSCFKGEGGMVLADMPT